MRHQPVMPAESVRALVADVSGTYIDATVGMGGHSRMLLNALSSEARLIGLDADPTALKQARKLLGEDSRMSFVHSRFSQMASLLPEGTVAGVLMDLGISSAQLDDEDRGFSFHAEQALDMRMDQTRGETGAQWLARLSAAELAGIFKDYADERYAAVIAEEIVRVRELMGGEMTAAGLSALICRIKPARDGRRHPATRAFQALRMLVNDEPGELALGLAAAEKLLQEGGRLVIISFHSREDRQVVGFLSETPALSVLGRGLRPSAAEVRANPRARSALMRTAQKTAQKTARTGVH